MSAALPGKTAKLGWTEGFEPSISRATTWRLRPLGHAHHNAARARHAQVKARPIVYQRPRGPVNVAT